ncbi:MAG: ChbG/HpnK family deacetylase [Lachnospiraceae bacterium]|nr:ChbG/HpnK family deacetylase [Lachnospiraceae bacterium]
MKVIFRADDMGYSADYNEGVLKAIDEGVVSSVDVMLDMPGSDHALIEMKKRPWVTMNWHPRFLLEPAQSDKDALLERLRAEVERCILLYGQAPFAVTMEDCAGSTATTVCSVAREYGILTDCCGVYGLHDYEGMGKTGLEFDNYREYDPLRAIQAMPETEGVTVCTMYPGFLDDFTLRLTLKTEKSQRNIHRIQDVVVLCSDELKAWILERKIEIVNLRDVVWGKQDYQNKLLLDHNPLAV